MKSFSNTSSKKKRGGTSHRKLFVHKHLGQKKGIAMATKCAENYDWSQVCTKPTWCQHFLIKKKKDEKENGKKICQQRERLTLLTLLWAQRGRNKKDTSVNHMYGKEVSSIDYF